MTEEEKYKIISNEYADLIIEYDRNERLLEQFKGNTVQVMNNRFAIVYIPTATITGRSMSLFGYSAIPSCYGLLGTASFNASGITRMRNLPNFNLLGQGTLIGFVDTGIDYTNPIFRKQDGTTRIISIWDQTIDSVDRFPGGSEYGEGILYGEPTYYGTEYVKEQIDVALSSQDPYSIVPSKDEIGHGTMLAGIAAGNPSEAQDFRGVAPEAEMVVVKLKQAKQILMNYFSIPNDVPCYQENDIMWGVQYLTRIARRLNRPMAICIGLGSSQGNHDGRGSLASMLSIAADFPGICITVAAGNEGNTRRHFYSNIDPAIGFKSVELYVSEKDKGFAMEIWGTSPGAYSIDILSPSGEQIQKIEPGLLVNREISFVFEETIILIDYQLAEVQTGEQLIILRFRNPTPGVWRFNVYGSGDLPESFHIWLPSGNFISPDTYFIQSNPYTTITSPGNAPIPITVTAYNPDNDVIYQAASRGYSSINVVKPDLAAPGVNLTAPTLEQTFQLFSGTSAAAAHTVGVTALLLEWGILKGNFKGITTVEVKKFLLRGAERNIRIRYPNKDWGYGALDIYNAFNILRFDV
ncbi:MAG: hypothetical protein K0S47_4527 [Herbinix sp.]|jgi:subtilisin family serine protease|nr:hypothetical protein [Herbinix sp.]